MLDAIRLRTLRFVQRVRKDAAYWICEWLCGYAARRTSCEINNAGAAIAAVRMFDMTRLLAVAEEDLPELLRECLPPFTPVEWKDVLSSARMDQGLIEDELRRHPEWDYLRRAPVT